MTSPHGLSPVPGARTPDVTGLTGKLLDDRYRIIKKVGEGGMCLVYMATDTASDETVAIKILLPALLADPISMGRLRREAALAGQLAHPNVCHIVRLGETPDGFDYVVMPYMQGDLLCDRVARAGHLPLDVTVAFVRHICAGLGVAHRLGIIHRDLKPENIMILPESDGTERAVVIDFSLATGANVAQLTAAGLVVGTPEFMSPEQLCGKDLDARSDIYSLAFMTYEMLTGQLPFDGKTAHEIMVARLKGVSIPIRTRRPDLEIPVPVERVLARGLAREPDQRYPSAEAFSIALTRAAAGDNPEGSNRVWRWIRTRVAK